MIWYYNIDNKTKVHDVSLLTRAFWAEHRIPAGTQDSLIREQVDILAVSTTEVKDRHGGIDQSVAEAALDGTRQIHAPNRSFVAGN